MELLKIWRRARIESLVVVVVDLTQLVDMPVNVNVHIGPPVAQPKMDVKTPKNLE